MGFPRNQGINFALPGDAPPTVPTEVPTASARPPSAASRPRISWITRDVLIPFLLTRSAILFIALTVGLFFAPQIPNPQPWQGGTSPIVHALARWDARWYLSIVRDGYQDHPGQQSNVAFAPLLPVFMKLGGIVLGANEDGWLVAGILVSNAALLVALIYLGKLIRAELDSETAARALYYLLIFPSSFFLSSVYPESLFLATSIAAIYHARRQQWWIAGLCAGLTALTRPHGAVIVLPLLVEYGTQIGFRWSRLRIDVLTLAIGPLVTLGWAVYLFRISGRPFLFFQAGTAWHSPLSPPWNALATVFTVPPALFGEQPTILGFGFALGFIALVAASWRLLPRSLALFATSLLVIQLSLGTLLPILRYELEIFPAFVVLAILGRNAVVDRTYVFIAVSLGVLCLAMFVSGYYLA